MASARPLREVFSELAASGPTADADALLEAHGHAELPDGLVAEAVVSYADTAPVEVAEHLAPFVMAHSAVYPEVPDPAAWLDMLATAPEPIAAEPIAAEPIVDDATEAGVDTGLDLDPADLDFGVGDVGAPGWPESAVFGEPLAADVPVRFEPLGETAPVLDEPLSSAPTSDDAAPEDAADDDAPDA